MKLRDTSLSDSYASHRCCFCSLVGWDGRSRYDSCCDVTYDAEPIDVTISCYNITIDTTISCYNITIDATTLYSFNCWMECINMRAPFN